jgi:recombination associated protein RdgC
MGLLSSSVSITRYHVQGRLESPILETVASGLKKHGFTEIEDAHSDRTVGWTSFHQPFQPNFDDRSFSVGTHLVFSLRIDKKTIPSKLFQKHYSLETAKRKRESGRPYLSRNEKNMIRDHVSNMLSLRILATPNIYDLIWDYEGASLLFFSTLKAANEDLETIFPQSFGVTPIRLFPYTSADLVAGLSDPERDRLTRLTPADFST